MVEPVFPVPVFEHAHMSRPANTRGIEANWIGVGCLYPASETAYNMIELKLVGKIIAN